MSRRRIIGVFVAVTCLPAATVLWLGVRLVEQDHKLQAQRKQEIREQAADRAVRSPQVALSDMVLFQSSPGNGAILVSYPVGPKMFRSDPAALPEASAELFREGEELEYRRGDLEKAAAEYRQLTGAKDAAARTGAWLHLPRSLRKAHQFSGALVAYDELSRIENVAAGGWPTSLLRIWGRCALLEELNKEKDLRESARSLRRSLDQGRSSKIPDRPSCSKRRRQSSTVMRFVKSCRARGWLGTPSAAPRTILARRTTL